MGRDSVTGRRRAIFLDRDGVLNRAFVRNGKPYPPASLSELELMPGVAAALTDLKRLGFLLVVVTNQPDVGRGTQRRDVVDSIHCRLRELLPIDDIFVCYHSDDAGCDCRKPAAGLILRAAEIHRIDLGSSYMIGDRWRDVEAGARAGCTAIQIDYSYREQAPAVRPALRVASLRLAADWIVRQEEKQEWRNPSEN